MIEPLPPRALGRGAGFPARPLGCDNRKSLTQRGTAEASNVVTPSDAPHPTLPRSDYPLPDGAQVTDAGQGVARSGTSGNPNRRETSESG